MELPGKLDLPNGNWAQLRSPDDLTNRERRDVLRDISALDGDIRQSDVLLDAFDLVLIALVVEWSYPEPPCTVEHLEQAAQGCRRSALPRGE